MTYYLWTRSNIEFDSAGCNLSISDAQATLSDMASASRQRDQVFALMILAFVCAGYSFLYFVGVCIASGQNYSLEDKNQFHLIAIITPGTLTQIGFAVTASISFSRILAETSALTDWQSFDGCVSGDPYMQVSDYGVQATADRNLWAILSLTGSWVVLCTYFG